MSQVLTRVSAHKHCSNVKAIGNGRGKLVNKNRVQARCSVCAEAIKTSDGTLCGFSADYHKLYRVGYAATLEDYLEILQSRITNFDLPLGASLESRPGGQVVLQVPKVTFMDLFIYPTSTLEVECTEGTGVVINALGTEIRGSHHVENLNCNDRFEMKLKVVLKPDDDLMDAKATFQLDVDVPFPLNVTPKPMIESAGNVAVQRTLSSLMDTLCQSIVKDHVAWSKSMKPAAVEREEPARQARLEAEREEQAQEERVDDLVEELVVAQI
eukprot:jgi/Ulvmu1/10267/UM060_0069.1